MLLQVQGCFHRWVALKVIDSELGCTEGSRKIPDHFPCYSLGSCWCHSCQICGHKMCCRTPSLQSGACRFLPGLVFIFPPCSWRHQWVVLDQSCSRAQEKQFSSFSALSLAGSVPGIMIPLCSPHLALLQGAYFYPCSFFLLHCPCGRELHPRKGSQVSGSKALLLLDWEQGCRFSSPIGVG